MVVSGRKKNKRVQISKLQWKNVFSFFGFLNEPTSFLSHFCNLGPELFLGRSILLCFFKDYFSTDLCSFFFFPSYSSFKILVNSIHNKNLFCKQFFTPKMMGYNQRVTETVIRDCCTYIAISPKPHRTYLVLEAQHILGHLFIFSWVRFYKFIYTTWIYRFFFPSISRVAIVSKSFEGKTDCTEEWYGTQYKQEAIPDEVIKVGLAHLWRSLMCEGHARTWAPWINQFPAQSVESRGPALSVPSQEA